MPAAADIFRYCRAADRIRSPFCTENLENQAERIRSCLLSDEGLIFEKYPGSCKVSRQDADKYKRTRSVF